MLNASKGLFNRTFRRVPVGVCDVAVVCHPVIKILPGIDAIATIAYKLHEMAYLDFVTLPAAILQVPI